MSKGGKEPLRSRSFLSRSLGWLIGGIWVVCQIVLITWGTLAIYYSNLPWAALRLTLAAAFAAFDTVLASVERTGRALVLHEAPLTGGFGGEIAAVIGERAFAHLDAPVVRVGSTDTPVPFSRRLEALHSARGRLLPGLRSLLAY